MRIFKDNSKIKALIVGLLLLMIFELVVIVSNAFVSQNEETELYRKSYAIQSELEKVFSNVFTISDAYSSYISDDPNLTREEAETFLKHLLVYEENYVKNIAYIEDTTIKFNYPYEENKESIGIDLSQIPQQSEDILYIKNTKESIFIGPIDLVQGGRAFILRSPVLIDDSYIGQIATVIDAEELQNLLVAEAEKYNVEIKIGYPREESFIFVGNNFDELNVRSTIANKHFSLQINVFDLSRSNSELLINYGIRIIGLLVTLLVVYYTYKNSNLNREVKFKATHDSLTNNFNRTKFVEDFESGKVAGKLIAFTDINKFKLLNDTLGHHFGDWGLIKITEEFNSIGKFIVYRNSGDEFFLVSNEPMTEQEFLLHTDKFSSSFYNESLDQFIDISLSVGVIENVRHDLKIEDMLMYLDYAMYDAKKQGLTYTLVDDSLMKRYNEQKYVEQFLIEDIKNNKFLTYYQPIIDVENQTIDSVEVLSRWEYNGEVLSAGRFIDVVKKIKYIEQVDKNLFNNLQKDYQILKKHCKTINEINFAINLSAELLKEFEKDYKRFDMFVEQVKIPINKIIFEISEDINLGIISDETLDYIKSKGYSLVTDDFGSGVSKLSDVLSGKLIAIKIDKSMLPKHKTDSKRRKGFNTIVKAVNSTGSTVCVEGVETEEQLHIAIHAGCRLCQGYLFAKPMSLDDIIQYIQTFDYNNYISE